MDSSNFVKFTSQQKEEILGEHGRTCDNIKEDVEIIKRWLLKQPHIPEMLADGKIEHFLYLGKFQFEKVKQSIDWYYSMRSILPKFFEDPEDPTMQTILNQFYFFPLPQLTSKHQRIIIMKLRTITMVENFEAKSYIAYCINIAEMLLTEDCPNAKILVFDLTNMKVEHSIKFTPVVMKKGLSVFEKAFCNSVRQIHVVNMPPLLETFLNLIKSFLTPKIAARLHFHKDANSLFSFIPKNVLPKDYGGEELSYNELHALWKQKLDELTPWFKERNSLHTNESLRVDKLINCDHLGFYGNFKRLNLD